MTVVDDVVPDFVGYVAAAQAQPFQTIEPAPGVVFHGIAPVVDDTVPAWMRARWPSLTPMTTFLRRSPAGQVEPNYVHTDRDMGDWTAILYLTAQPLVGDGTTFWRHRQTGAIESTTADDVSAWRDRAQWEPWQTVEARPNRLLVFPAPYYHSRALLENYGSGETARLIQVVFGTGAL